MATSKTLTPTNVTISIPAMADTPDMSVVSNCIDKSADAINALDSMLANVSSAGSYEAASLSNPSTLKAAISAVFTSKVSAVSGSAQIALFSYTGGGRWVAIIHKNSANYGTAFLFSYNDASHIFKYTYANGTETLHSFAGTAVT